MATYDREFGDWRAADGTPGFPTREAAEEYEATGSGSSKEVYASMANEFGSGPLTGPAAAGGATAPQRPVSADGLMYTDAQGGYTPEYYSRQQAISQGNALAASGRQTTWSRDDYADPASAYNRGIAMGAKDRHGDGGGLLGDLGRLGAYAVGAAANPIGFIAGDYIPEPVQAVVNPVGYGTQKVVEQAAGFLPGGSGTGVDHSGGGASMAPTGAGGTAGITTPPRPGGAAPGPAGSTGTGAVAYEEAVAGDQAQRDQDRTSLNDMYEQARFDASEESRESRELQRQAIASQQKLYDVLTQFDPDAYSERASELALKNQLAIARSQPGAAAEQAGLFAAMQQAPGIHAEAERNALTEQDRRLGMASGVAAQMGELASSTRGQDIGEQQLKSDFGIRIADGISQMTGLDWQLDSGESKTLADVALALDAANLDWAQLDLDAQVAEANRIISEAGLTQAWRMFKDGQKLTEKDIYGGLLSILGTGVGGIFQIEAAKAGGRR